MRRTNSNQEQILNVLKNRGNIGLTSYEVARFLFLDNVTKLVNINETSLSLNELVRKNKVIIEYKTINENPEYKINVYKLIEERIQ